MENEDWVTGNIRIAIGGEPFDLQVTVPAKPIKPQRMLPVFQQMTGSFLDMSVGAVEKMGETISCAKGCGACCRQLVPVAEIEAFKLAEIVEAMPEPQRERVERRFETAWRHFLENGWLQRFEEWGHSSKEDDKTLSIEYFHEGVPCPFLEDESCSIHPDRPLVCREYLVTSPAENCANPTPETVKRVGLLVETYKTLQEVTNSEKLRGSINFVPLILALQWAKKNRAEFPEKTGEQWMAEFFTNLTKQEIPKQG